jgi:hypothetical protein
MFGKGRMTEDGRQTAENRRQNVGQGARLPDKKGGGESDRSPFHSGGLPGRRICQVALAGRNLTYIEYR